MKFKPTKYEDHAVKIKDQFGDKLNVSVDDIAKSNYFVFNVNDETNVIVPDKKAVKLAKLILKTVEERTY